MAKHPKPPFDPRFDPAFQRGYQPPAGQSAPVIKPARAMPVTPESSRASKAARDASGERFAAPLSAPVSPPTAALPPTEDVPSAPSRPSSTGTSPTETSPTETSPAQASPAQTSPAQTPAPGGWDASEEAAVLGGAPSAVNPYIVALWIAGIVFTVGGVVLYVSSTLAQIRYNASFQGDPSGQMIMNTIEYILAPPLVTVGLAILAGLTFRAALRWRPRR